MRKWYLIFGLILVGLIVNNHSIVGQDVKPSVKSDLSKLWNELNIDPYYHIGLAIYDADIKKWVFQNRADNFFIPASNIKLVTMWSALRYLDQNIAAGYYLIKNDSLIIWGGGDPGSFYPDITQQGALAEFLRNTDKKIFFSDDHFTAGRFGRGWSWDDFGDDYQVERTAFPIYGNRLWIDRYQDSIVMTPSYFELVTKIEPSEVDTAYRNEWGTQYHYEYIRDTSHVQVTIPIELTRNDIKLIWEKAIGKDIEYIHRPFQRNAIRLPGTKIDSLIFPMMQESDNFIAEQLLLSVALHHTGEMNEKKFIDIQMKGPLSGLPDKIQWIDGSGLSRYNLMTPRSCIWFLDKIIEQKGLAYLKTMLPAGGVSGSLTDWYKGKNGVPYIFAKTGTLKNNHCLSGILVTKSGKTLLFSWMNNQFTVPSKVIKEHMQKIFIWLRDNY
ncbi:MAG: D-alanyl-D-alanine carboxypeptidase [Bacteroidota bacterium]|nr:D-alanyl-D-alanine carboxypeptidase [Bacteroidota bacterium]